MKKAMISQPMNGLSDEQIMRVKRKAKKHLEDLGYEVLDTFFNDEFCSRDKLKGAGVIQIPLYFLAKSINSMALCNAVYFCKGYENARGCRIEHDIALAYGLETIYEKEE